MSMESPGAQEAPKKYREKKEVNGIDIEVGWASSDHTYNIYFPQISLENSETNGVPDQVIRLSDKDESAKKIFAEAIKLAETEASVYSLYRKLARFADEVIYNEEEDDD